MREKIRNIATFHDPLLLCSGLRQRRQVCDIPQEAFIVAYLLILWLELCSQSSKSWPMHSVPLQAINLSGGPSGNEKGLNRTPSQISKLSDVFFLSQLVIFMLQELVSSLPRMLTFSIPSRQPGRKPSPGVLTACRRLSDRLRSLEEQMFWENWRPHHQFVPFGAHLS